MMSRILPILTQRDAIINACCYSIKLLMKFKNFAKAAQEFISSDNCIVQMYEAASSDNDDIAISAIILLVILIKLQVKSSLSLFKKLITKIKVKCLSIVAKLIHCFSIDTLSKYTTVQL